MVATATKTSKPRKPKAPVKTDAEVAAEHILAEEPKKAPLPDALLDEALIEYQMREQGFFPIPGHGTMFIKGVLY